MALPRHTTDAALSAWLVPRLLPWGPAGVPVGATVPTGFAAYVRVLHPLPDGRRWREIAASKGRVLHPLAQWSHFFDTLTTRTCGRRMAISSAPTTTRCSRTCRRLGT